MNTTEQQILTGGASLTHEEDDNLIELLYKVRKDKYRWPTEASMRAAHGTVSHWATELVITRPPHPSMTGSHVLLARYEGGFEDWKQREVWHIPGGFNTPPDQSRASGLFWNFKSLQPVATKVARRELGVDVEVQALMDLFWWPSPTKEWREDIGQHPYGCPLSIFLKCTIEGEFGETDRIRFFPTSDLPEPMVVPHQRFIEDHLVHWD